MLHEAALPFFFFLLYVFYRVQPPQWLLGKFMRRGIAAICTIISQF